MTDARGSPIAARRRLAAELRRLRGNAAKTLDEAAECLECSPAKISRIETAQVGARVPDVRELLICYGVTGRPQEELLDLVRLARGKAWWEAYGELLRDDFLTYLGMEDAASSLSIYHPYLVPSLLQTDEYARTLLSAMRHDSLERVEQAVEFRRRRRGLLDRPNAPRLTVVLDESVLYRVPSAAVLTAQVAYLRELAERPGVSLRVRPMSAEAYPGGFAPFTILGFAGPGDPSGVFAETMARGFYLEDARQVGEYSTVFDALAASAWGEAESDLMISALSADPATRPAPPRGSRTPPPAPP